MTRARKSTALAAGGTFFLTLFFSLFFGLRAWSLWAALHPKLITVSSFVSLGVALLCGSLVLLLKNDNRPHNEVTPSINAPGGIVATGGAVISNAQIYNDHRQFAAMKSLPQIRKVGEKRFDDPSKFQLSFFVVSSFQNPMFLIRCDQPCAGLDIFFNEAFAGTGESPFIRTEDPRVLIVGSGSRNFLSPNVKVDIIVRSLNGRPIYSVDVVAHAI